MKLKVFSVFLFIFMSFFSFSQSGWKLVHDENGIKVSTKEADCNVDGAHLQKWFLIKVENQMADFKLIEWDLNLFDQNNKCLSCNGSEEYHVKFKMAGNETLEGKCSKNAQPELRIIERFLDIKTVSEIMDVKLVNIKASALK
ncbi:MAG: hypothetical protein Q8M29_04785 [Bacteroidota bacterium]|nr:hypothetical protein [Bacteroidota bacterium]